MGSKAEEENKEEEASSTPKLPLFLTIPPPLQSPEHSGMLTPPLHASATVPFRWEEEPGKPLPSTTTTAITPPPSPPSKYFLELPPRLQIMESSKMTKMPSPNTVLDGPYHLGMMPPVFRSSSFRVRRRERQGSFGSSCESPSEKGQLGALVFLSKEERGGGLFGSWRRKQQHYPRKEVIGGEGSFVFSSPSSMDLADFVGGGKVKKMSRIRRNGSSFSSLSQVKSHFWNTSTMLQILKSSDSSKKIGGSVVGHKYIRRDRRQGHDRLFADYFALNPVYSATIFRRRFRMRRPLYLRILNAIEAHNSYFIQKQDAAHVVGLSALQKMTSAMRILSYGVAADAVDDYIRIGESTVIQSLQQFCNSVIEIFGEEYLRSPTPTDIARLLAIGEVRGFPGMLGSLDCMHWEWKNCPKAWQGQYVGHQKKPTIILEAVASYDLWIWHAFFGMPGSHNDLNMLDRSSLFSDLAQGNAPPVHYTINGHSYDMGYYLADGIYPQWATLVQTISSPQGAKRQHFAMMQ